MSSPPEFMNALNPKDLGMTMIDTGANVKAGGGGSGIEKFIDVNKWTNKTVSAANALFGNMVQSDYKVPKDTKAGGSGLENLIDLDKWTDKTLSAAKYLFWKTIDSHVQVLKSSYDMLKNAGPLLKSMIRKQLPDANSVRFFLREMYIRNMDVFDWMKGQGPAPDLDRFMVIFILMTFFTLVFGVMTIPQTRKASLKVLSQAFEKILKWDEATLREKLLEIHRKQHLRKVERVEAISQEWEKRKWYQKIIYGAFWPYWKLLDLVLFFTSKIAGMAIDTSAWSSTTELQRSDWFFRRFYDSAIEKFYRGLLQRYETELTDKEKVQLGHEEHDMQTVMGWVLNSEDTRINLTEAKQLFSFSHQDRRQIIKLMNIPHDSPITYDTALKCLQTVKAISAMENSVNASVLFDRMRELVALNLADNERKNLLLATHQKGQEQNWENAITRLKKIRLKSLEQPEEKKGWFNLTSDSLSTTLKNLKLSEEKQITLPVQILVLQDLHLDSLARQLKLPENDLNATVSVILDMLEKNPEQYREDKGKLIQKIHFLKTICAALGSIKSQSFEDNDLGKLRFIQLSNTLYEMYEMQLKIMAYGHLYGQLTRYKVGPYYTETLNKILTSLLAKWNAFAQQRQGCLDKTEACYGSEKISNSCESPVDQDHLLEHIVGSETLRVLDYLQRVKDPKQALILASGLSKEDIKELDKYLDAPVNEFNIGTYFFGFLGQSKEMPTDFDPRKEEVFQLFKMLFDEHFNWIFETSINDMDSLLNLSSKQDVQTLLTLSENKQIMHSAYDQIYDKTKHDNFQTYLEDLEVYMNNLSTKAEELKKYVMTIPPDRFALENKLLFRASILRALDLIIEQTDNLKVLPETWEKLQNADVDQVPELQNTIMGLILDAYRTYVYVYSCENQSRLHLCFSSDVQTALKQSETLTKIIGEADASQLEQ